MGSATLFLPGSSWLQRTGWIRLVVVPMRPLEKTRQCATSRSNGQRSGWVPGALAWVGAGGGNSFLALLQELV